MPSGPGAFPFKKLLISLLISSIKIIGLILSAFYSIIVFILMSLRSAIPVLGKNLAAKMSAFVVLLSVKGSSVDLLKSGKWGSAFTTLTFLFHFNRIQSPLLYGLVWSSVIS